MNLKANIDNNKIQMDTDSHFTVPASLRKQYNDYIQENLTLNNKEGCLHCGSEIDASKLLDDREIVEVESLGLLGHDFCLCNSNFVLADNEYVIVKFNGAIEFAKVKNIGKIVRIRRYILGLNGEELPIVLRRATEEDLAQNKANIKNAINARPTFEQFVKDENLNMKLVNIHYQFDRKKLFFFYTSDGRVDFRTLAKKLAGAFKTRIELRQMGVRDEAKLIGGVGSCGREFCCTTFIHNFKRITTEIASEQNISSNFSKLSGPCGKLKCCLAFELD